MFPDGSYYRNEYWPEDMDSEILRIIKSRKGQIVHSHHCSEKIIENYISNKNSFTRRYNVNDITKDFVVKGTPIKAYVRNGRIYKVLIRVPYTEIKYIDVVLAFEDFSYKPCLLCVTAWVYISKSNYGVFKKNKRRKT